MAANGIVPPQTRGGLVVDLDRYFNARGFTIAPAPGANVVELPVGFDAEVCKLMITPSDAEAKRCPLRASLMADPFGGALNPATAQCSTRAHRDRRARARRGASRSRNRRASTDQRCSMAPASENAATRDQAQKFIDSLK
jgi:hypothetical protein